MGASPVSAKRLIVAVLLGSLAVGCGGGPPPANMPIDKQHIMALGMLWSDYKRVNKKEPASPDELKSWAKKLKPDELSKLGITDLEKAFISPRDNEPYKFRSPGKDNPMGLGTVLYEAKGVNGKRLTASNMGNASEMTDEEFNEWRK